MAKKVYEAENIEALAAKMRELTETDTQYTTYDMVDGVQDVYESGYLAAKADINGVKEKNIEQDASIKENADAIAAIEKEQTTQSQEISSVKAKADGLATSKQDNLAFDGTYNAESNKVATEYTVAKKVAELVASAPEDFDTLKEIADYIANDTTGAAEINNKLAQHTTNIAKNATDIETNKTAIETIEAEQETQKDSISANASAIADLEAKHDADIGDIGSALDELHTYAQNLVSGGEA